MKKEQNLKAEETLCRDSDRRNTFPCCDQEGKSRGYARTATVVCVCVCVCLHLLNWWRKQKERGKEGWMDINKIYVCACK